MKNHYAESWEFYKTHSESFNDDYEYYREFCWGYKTLEMFAGYGRLTNFLVSRGIDIESVEFEPNFSQFIKLPFGKNHTCDILRFLPDKKYERIIAAYNSFCLLLEDNQITQFFCKLNDMMEVGAKASLSYYPISAWRNTPTQQLNFKDVALSYSSRFDLSQTDKNVAVWIDEYLISSNCYTFKYPVRIYNQPDDIIKFTNNTSLRLIKIVNDYDADLVDKGWQEFVFIKTGS